VHVNVGSEDNVISIRSGQLDEKRLITGIGKKISLYPVYEKGNDGKKIIISFDFENCRI